MAHPVRKAGNLLALVLGPLGGVRDFCLDCQGGESEYVRSCQDSFCPLFGFRESALAVTVSRLIVPEEQHSALRAIRRQCVVCAGGPHEVRSCDARGQCALWEYRFGIGRCTGSGVVSRFSHKN